MDDLSNGLYTQQKVTTDLREARTRNMTRGHYTPEFQAYREIGDCYGQPAQVEAKHLLIHQLSNGLRPEVRR